MVPCKRSIRSPGSRGFATFAAILIGLLCVATPRAAGAQGVAGSRSSSRYVLRDGRRIEGVLVAEDALAVTLYTAIGPVRIAKHEIAFVAGSPDRRASSPGPHVLIGSIGLGASWGYLSVLALISWSATGDPGVLWFTVPLAGPFVAYGANICPACRDLYILGFGIVEVVSAVVLAIGLVRRAPQPRGWAIAPALGPGTCALVLRMNL